MGSSNLDSFVCGQVEGTGAAITVSLRFTPRRVVLVNVDGDVRLDWDRTMVNGGGYKIAYGSAYALITTGGVTPIEYLDREDGDPGFSIGTDTDVNASGETIHYYAWE